MNKDEEITYRDILINNYQETEENKEEDILKDNLNKIDLEISKPIS